MSDIYTPSLGGSLAPDVNAEFQRLNATLAQMANAINAAPTTAQLSSIQAELNALTAAPGWKQVTPWPTSGKWTTDSAPNWAGSSAAQKANQGYWSNDAGYADGTGGDPTSLNASVWS